MKKCSGLLFLLFTIFGLSLNVSSNTSALQHEYKTIPAFGRTYFGSTDSSSDTINGFTIQWSSPYSAPSTSIKRQTVMSSVYSGSECSYERFGQSPGSIDNVSGYSTASFTYGIWDFSYYVSSYCNTPYGFGSSLPSSHFLMSSTPSFLSSSIPSGLVNLAYMNDLRNQLPYPFAYDHFYLKDSATVSDTTYTTDLKISDLFAKSESPVIVSKFSYLRFPFDEIDQSLTGPMISGRPLEFKGTFYFPGASYSSGFSWNPEFFSSGIFRFDLTYFEPGTSHHGVLNIPCSLRTVSLSAGLGVVYSCPTTLPSDMSNSHLIPVLVLSSGSSSDPYIFDTTVEWSWSGAYLTTDNDDTPGSVISSDCVGNNCDDAPGSASGYYSSSSDWFSSLTNLFNFSLLNPFAPLFEMFVSPSEQSCASIPILSGMLHSTETSYCSWFDSSTRAVLTPVLGFASVMLLFGFFVRWLSSSSGNMFEDQTVHKWGNTQFKQKGGK